jgi:hypothetical protein
MFCDIIILAEASFILPPRRFIFYEAFPLCPFLSFKWPCGCTSLDFFDSISSTRWSTSSCLMYVKPPYSNLSPRKGLMVEKANSHILPLIDLATKLLSPSACSIRPNTGVICLLCIVFDKHSTLKIGPMSSCRPTFALLLITCVSLCLPNPGQFLRRCCLDIHFDMYGI